MIPSRSSKSKFQRQDVKFLLPQYHKEQQRIASLSSILPKNKAHTMAPIQLLEEVETYLKQLNRNRLLEARRVEILAKLTNMVYKQLEQAFNLYRHQHSVPEVDNRKSLINLCANVCQEISLGYLRVCQHDFQSSKLRFQRNRERTILCTHRALEFLYLQQRFRALRYQVLQKDCWSNINQLIFAAFFEEFHDESLLPVVVLTLQQQNNASPLSISQLSMMIHLFAAANICTLPVPAINEIANYIHRCRLDEYNSRSR